jgi:hypothetical protein
VQPENSGVLCLSSFSVAFTCCLLGIAHGVPCLCSSSEFTRLHLHAMHAARLAGPHQLRSPHTS